MSSRKMFGIVFVVFIVVFVVQSSAAPRPWISKISYMFRPVIGAYYPANNPHLMKFEKLEIALGVEKDQLPGIAAQQSADLCRYNGVYAAITEPIPTFVVACDRTPLIEKFTKVVDGEIAVIYWFSEG